MSERGRIPVLTVRDLGIRYDSGGFRETAVDGVSFEVHGGEIAAIVGESGSGKSTVATAITALLPDNAIVDAGSSIVVNDVEVLGAPPAVLRAIRGAVVSYVPQDPRRSLHPLKRIGEQIGEVLLEHRVCTKAQVAGRVAELLEKVGIDRPSVRARQYPHEFSGGMLQRVLIAIAIAARPALIVADEPTSALDVTVQKQILTLLERIVADDGVAILLITHDLELVAQYARTTVVLRHGKLVERAETADLFDGPEAAYTRALLAASPVIAPRAPRPDDGDRVLQVDDVVKEHRLRGAGVLSRGEQFRAVDGVSFELGAGRTLAIVGESGAGKTSLARLVLGLDAPTSGTVRFEGQDVHRLDRDGRRRFRRGTQLIPQNPASTFDPRFTVGDVVAEPLARGGVRGADARRRVLELLDHVGLPGHFAGRNALSLSGGQQQRVAIARAISLSPRFIVCDEPTSALDVTVQARIIDLLEDLQQETGVSYLFISHNLAVVSELADEIVVLRRGRVVERGDAATVLTAPEHDYTRELLASVPRRAVGA